MMNKLSIVTSLGLAALFSLAACDSEPEVWSYVAPREEPSQPGARGAGATRPAPRLTATEGPTNLRWAVPEGWQSVRGDDGVTWARVFPADEADRDAASVDVTITRLGSDVLNDPPALRANIDRWRGQMMLGPINESEVDLRDLLSLITTDGGVQGIMVDLRAEAAFGGERMLVAIFEDAGATWFFRMRGEMDDVDHRLPEFEAMVRSVRWRDDAARQRAEQQLPQPGHQPGTAERQIRTFQVPGVAGYLPPQWEHDPSRDSSFRVATFVIHDHAEGQHAHGGHAEVVLSRFENVGAMADPLANVNRWRGEVGLPQVSRIEEQDYRTFELDGREARIYRFAAPGDSPDRPFTLAMMAPRGESTWFVKLTAPAQLVERQISPFLDFVFNLKFTGPNDD